jgi:glycosyltransferase involved in cell wall biosynthesis
VLRETLEHLACQTIGGRTLEILLIDDGPSPEIEALAVRFAGGFQTLRYLPQNNEGQSRARNRGAALAQAELLFFTGDDILLEADALRKHKAFHEDPAHGKAAAVGMVEVDPRLKSDPFVSWLNRGGPQNVFYQLKDRGTVGPSQVETAHLSIKKENALLAAFREDIRYYENYLWALQLGEKGIGFHFLPDALSWHYHPTTPGQYAERMFNIGRTIAFLESNGSADFAAVAKTLRPAGRAKMVRHKILHRLLFSGKYLEKYWNDFLNNKRYQGYLGCRT